MVTLLRVFKGDVIESVLVSEVTEFQEPLSKTCFMTLLFIILKLEMANHLMLKKQAANCIKACYR